MATGKPMDFRHSLVHGTKLNNHVGDRGARDGMWADGDQGRLERRNSALAEQDGVPLPARAFHMSSASQEHVPDDRPEPVKRALLVASAGGHWIELCRLEAAFQQWECQFVSTATGMNAPIGSRAVLQIHDSSRDDIGTMIRSLGQLRRIIGAFRPDIVISTGAAPGALALLLGKLAGARTIWIDSIANSEELSLSGRAVRYIADLRLTQWPALADQKRNIHYFGQVL